jgi:FAD binding domain/D-arabinono-1,4-lactone oxidase
MPTHSFTNWNGSASSHPSVVASPKDLDELIEVVKDRDTYPSPVRAAGSFHSLNACFATTGTQVLLGSFNGIRVDPESKTITVGAAVTMVQIRDALRPFGMQTEVQPEIGNATAGSVVCCGTKDASMGPKGLAQVSSTVIAVKVVNPQGEIEEVSEDTDPDRLRAIRSSYGLLGVVFEVTFRIQRVVMLRYDYAVFSLTPPPTRAQLMGGAGGMLGLVLPYANRIVVERRWVAGDGRRHISGFSRMKRYARDKLWELASSFLPTLLPYNWAFGVMDRGFVVWLRALSLMGGFTARRADSTVDFKFKRRHYFDFTFWTIPVSRWAEFIPAYLRFCDDFKRETGFRASLISEAYAMNQDDRSLLSPTADEDVFTMDVTDTRMNDPRWAEFHRRLNPVVAGFGGRPLLNQTKHLSREVVYQTLGVDWERFVKIRETEDPDGRFLSDYFKELI